MRVGKVERVKVMSQELKKKTNGAVSGKGENREKLQVTLRVKSYEWEIGW